MQRYRGCNHGQQYRSKNQNRRNPKHRHLIHIRNPFYGSRKPISDEHLDQYRKRGARQQRTHQRRDRTFQNERQSNRPVRSTHQTHDFRFGFARRRRHTNRGTGQHNGNNHHHRGQCGGRNGSAVQYGKNRLENLPLVTDGIDTFLAGKHFGNHLVFFRILEFEPQ